MELGKYKQAQNLKLLFTANVGEIISGEKAIEFYQRGLKASQMLWK